MNKSTPLKFDRNLLYNDFPDLPPSENVIDKEVLMKWRLATIKHKFLVSHKY